MNETVETITAVQALGVALSIPAGTMTMGECQDAAPAMLEHLQAMGFDIVRRDLLCALVESEKRVKAVLEAAETEWLNGNMEESAFDRIEARAALLEGEPDAR